MCQHDSGCNHPEGECSGACLSAAARLIWQPHTRKPDGIQTALIAVPGVSAGDPDDGPFLLPGIYQFDTRYDCWMNEFTGLKLRYTAFWWILEADILASLPR